MAQLEYDVTPYQDLEHFIIAIYDNFDRRGV
jgi:hypothetical protein